MASPAPRIWAVVPAAGVGRRMGAQLPKQYLEVAGKCVLEHTLLALGKCAQITGTVVAVANTDPYWQNLQFEQQYAIARVAGGNDRAESVLNGLNHLAVNAQANDWALVHDAVRPCLGQQQLRCLIEVSMRCEDGAILAIPVRDTLKRVQLDRINETVAREDLWQAQTPQMFPLLKLQRALQNAADNGLSITDEAQAMELAGHRPIVIEGRADNIKITRPEDLHQAGYYLQSLENSQCA